MSSTPQHESTLTNALLPSAQLASLLQIVIDLKRRRMVNGSRYAGFEDLVLTDGNAMPIKHSAFTIDRGLPRQCYANCLKIAKKNKMLHYCEGFALANTIPIPVPHAWLWHSTEGTILEPTWDKPGTAYWGIAFQTDWLVSFLKARRRHDITSVFEGNYLEKYSLLREGLPPGAYHSQAIKAE